MICPFTKMGFEVLKATHNFLGLENGKMTSEI